MVYRQYENPRELECELEIAREKLSKLEETDKDYEMKLEVLHEIVSDLEDRVNFAWQDEESEENYRLYGE